MMNSSLAVRFFVVIAVCCMSFIGAYAGEKTETVKVWGNCGMCKKTIEKSLKDVAGVHSAVWDKKTKVLTVSYDADKISMKQIEEKVAASGYDTKNVKGSDKAYSELEKCCRYDRKKS